jgi:biopolymer transport protein ExbD
VRFEPRTRARRGPGLTPLIDIVFLLLIFFMLASRLGGESQLRLAVLGSMPVSGPAPLVIEIDAAGGARIAGEVLDDARLQAAIGASRGRGVRVRAHPESELQPTVRVLSLLGRAGASRVALALAD